MKTAKNENEVWSARASIHTGVERKVENEEGK